MRYTSLSGTLCYSQSYLCLDLTFLFLVGNGCLVSIPVPCLISTFSFSCLYVYLFYIIYLFYSWCFISGLSLYNNYSRGVYCVRIYNGIVKKMTFSYIFNMFNQSLMCFKSMQILSTLNMRILSKLKSILLLHNMY